VGEGDVKMLKIGREGIAVVIWSVCKASGERWTKGQ